MDEAQCQHEWVIEEGVASGFAQSVRRICKKCGRLETISKGIRRAKGETFYDVYEHFYGGKKRKT